MTKPQAGAQLSKGPDPHISTNWSELPSQGKNFCGSSASQIQNLSQDHTHHPCYTRPCRTLLGPSGAADTVGSSHDTPPTSWGTRCWAFGRALPQNFPLPLRPQGASYMREWFLQTTLSNPSLANRPLIGSHSCPQPDFS